MKTVRYCLEFDLPDDKEERSDLINHLLGKRFKVMHMDIHSVTVCKEYDVYSTNSAEAGDG